jgi:hydroxymethylbilane synthase
MGQASLGIQIVSSNKTIEKIVKKLNHKNSSLCAKLERDFIATIGAGCSAPVACNAKISDDIVDMEVMIGLPDGTDIIYHKATALKAHCDHLGSLLANDCVLNGSQELLEKAQQIVHKQSSPDRI